MLWNQVEARWEERDGSLQIRIVDNGPGVAGDIRAELFQSFVSHGKAAGTGLGLAIVRKICEEHSGSVALESSEPGRIVFCMTRPLQDRFELHTAIESGSTDKCRH